MSLKNHLNVENLFIRDYHVSDVKLVFVSQEVSTFVFISLTYFEVIGVIISAIQIIEKV